MSSEKTKVWEERITFRVLLLIFLGIFLSGCAHPSAKTEPVATNAGNKQPDPPSGVSRYGMKPGGSRAIPVELTRPTVMVTSCPIHLRDVTEESGVDFRHTDGSSGRHYIVEAMTGGVALFDYDGDGLEDIYFLNGSPLPGTVPPTIPTNGLYRNLGNFRFEDVSRLANAADEGFGLGVGVGDYNNDGFLDLYINNFGPNVLLRNNGDGTFTDVTRHAGVINGEKVGAGVAFLDIDKDGDLDLYVGNYLEFRYDQHVERTEQGYPVYPSPRDFQALPDTLYRNEGDGTFTDISIPSGIAVHAGTCMGIVAADYDGDCDVDVFVCNDVDANFLFINDGTGHFEEMGLLLGAAYNGWGDENASMGVDCGDYDNDGLLDFIMTSYQGEFPVLYRNMGEGRVEDVSAATNVGPPLFHYVNWGVGFVDFDNDGYRDIFIANGHTEDFIDFFDQTTSYKNPNTVLWNLRNGKFADVSRLCGSGLQPVHASRGAGLEDLDNDGRVDVVVLNSREHATIIRNETPLEHRWIMISLFARSQNRFGIGARVTVFAQELQSVAEVISGRGYQSHWGLRLHFGLGKARQVDRVEIRWLDGTVESFGPVEPNQWIVYCEGEGPISIKGP